MPAEAAPPGAAPPGCTWEYQPAPAQAPVVAAPSLPSVRPAKPLLRHVHHVHHNSPRIVKPIGVQLPIHHARRLVRPHIPITTAFGAAKAVAGTAASGAAAAGIYVLVCGAQPAPVVGPHLSVPPVGTPPPVVVTPPGTPTVPGNPTVVPVPEPGMLALVGGGLVLLIGLDRHRRRAARSTITP